MLQSSYHPESVTATKPKLDEIINLSCDCSDYGDT